MREGEKERRRGGDKEKERRRAGEEKKDRRIEGEKESRRAGDQKSRRTGEGAGEREGKSRRNACRIRNSSSGETVMMGIFQCNSIPVREMDKLKGRDLGAALYTTSAR